MNEFLKGKNKLLEKTIKNAKDLDYCVTEGFLANENKFIFFEKNKTGDLIVLIHGLGNNLIYLNQQFVSYFLENEMNVLIFNLDGHGDNTDTNFSYRSFSTTIEPALDYANSKGNYKIHLLGYSLGAYLAARYVSQNPDKVDSIHMVAPLGSTKLSLRLITNEIRALINPSVLSSLVKWGVEEMIPALGPFRRNKYPLKHEEESILKAVPKWLEKDEELGFFSISKNIAGTIIYGELDEICPARDLDLWKMRFPYLEAHIVKGGSHLTTPLHKQCCEFIHNEIKKEKTLLSEKARAV